ncbi:MAG: DUF4231 domain-containing protein [Ignavibacteria bacterium]|jgi:hypothetical protein
MNAEEYLGKRLQDQIDWYSKKSSTNKTFYKTLRTSEIILSATIPFVSGITGVYESFEQTGLIILGIIGVIISCIAGILSLGQFQEHWIEYRTTCESLKKEKYLFETGVEPYDNDSAFDLLVHSVEGIVSRENTYWAKYMKKASKRKNGEN